MDNNNETTAKGSGDNHQHHCRGKRSRRVVRGIFAVFALIGVISVGCAIFKATCGHAHGGHMWGQGEHRGNV